MKNYIVINVFIFLISYAIISCKFLEKDDTTENKKQFSSISAIDLLPTSTTKQIIVHDFYTLSYNEKFEQAEWVAYSLKKENFKQNNFKRPYFVEDKKVTTHSADWRNYKKSGYDKGHLCPAGDMTFSKKAYEDTFLTSNISPQKHDFNSGIWNRLEQKTRYWAEKYGTVFVISGGVLTSGLKTIGFEKVAVPNYFYKIIASKSNGQIKVIAFLVPNEDSKKPLYTFVTSIDAIEKLTNIDFFSKWEDSVENKLESKSDYKDWSFN
ncbi:MAG TPA: DNA/RNA non-specific endonuclease [Flavobacterium sp.]|uniref:DNA/RNA non-specific endonuclease n=1 Tax=Flavobacterium sp. TaxID=239 RepID=UPI002B87322F|nr:DNA/RNA non-specific endonuclease [Flavobacterium sp.]HPW97115.1 DNA/RNA non-specific endonuclease [Flavobacterium sp.]HQA73540.1 DNA/RNA non-specific endonuclease [Flavobacterium sp.]